MKNTNKTLTVIQVEPLNKIVVPKPTKREIIEAMVQIEHPRLVAEWKEKKEAHEKERVALEKLVVAETKKQIRSLSAAYVDLGSRSDVAGKETHYGADVRFDNIALPASLQARILAHLAIRVSYHAPLIDAVRKQITAKMQGYTNPGERVAKLLADPESKKVLAEMLAALPK